MVWATLRKVFAWTRESLAIDTPRPAFLRAIVLLIAAVFLISPPMRFFQSNFLMLILIVGIFYHVLLGLVALAVWTPTEAPPVQVIDWEQSTRNNVQESSMSHVDNNEDFPGEEEDKLLQWTGRVLSDLKKVSPYVPAYSKLSVPLLSVLMRLDAREQVVGADSDGLRQRLVELGLVSRNGRFRPNGVRLARHLRKLGCADLLRLWTRNEEQAIQLITNS